MTNYEFTLLPEKEKYHVVLHQGTYLNRIEIEGKKILLYSVSNFYVELSFDDKTDEINFLRTFKNISQLDPYL